MEVLPARNLGNLQTRTKLTLWDSLLETESGLQIFIETLNQCWDVISTRTKNETICILQIAKMLYLEDYLEMIEHLPIELRDRFTEMREIDLGVENTVDSLEVTKINSTHFRTQKIN